MREGLTLSLSFLFPRRLSILRRLARARAPQTFIRSFKLSRYLTKRAFLARFHVVVVRGNVAEDDDDDRREKERE